MNIAKSISRRRAGGILFGGLLATSLMPVLAEGEKGLAVPYVGNDAIEILENDHKRIHHLLDVLVEDVPARKNTLMQLAACFTVHNATEENYIYPAIAAIAQQKEDALVLYHQQDEAKMVMWSLDRMIKMHPADTDGFTLNAKKLRAAALLHVHLEENTDFPKLRSALGSQALMQMTADVRAFRAHLA